MKNIEGTIKRLRTIINDVNCKKMNLSNIKGYLGELLVAQKLINEGHPIIQRGNQSGYDIEIPNSKIKIDVKFSTIKSEVANCPPYWGWALKHKNKQKEISCSHFVCVAVDENLEPLNYYIILASNLHNFPTSAIKQFKNVDHGCVLLQSHKKHSIINDIILNQYFLTCKDLLRRKMIIKISSSAKLMPYLKKY
jgi:hypothetical protein